MKPGRVAAAAAFIAVAALLARPARADAAEPASERDAGGRSLRTSFDPGQRTILGVGWAFDSAAPRRSDSPALSVATDVALRQRIAFTDEGIAWKLQHDIVRAQVTAGPKPSIVGEAYHLHFLRWSADGGIVLPTTPPRRLPFPLDVGFDVGVGSVDVRRDRGLAGEIGVARGEVLFDVLRRPDHRGFLTLGVGPRYSLRVDDGRVVDQIVVPFSEPEIEMRFELGRGHHVLAARAGGGYAWSAGHGGGKQARAEASYEIVAIALNDCPVSIRSEASIRYDDPALPGRRPFEARGGASAVFGLPLSP